MTRPMALREPSLLEKLLAKDIRAEHSRLLQCMRFIVANNFLQDVGSKPLQFPAEPCADPAQAPGTYALFCTAGAPRAIFLMLGLKRGLAEAI